MSNREIGIVKWFSQAKGYGFIARADGTEVFVHYRAITWPGFRTLREGQRVSFELVLDPRSNRPQANLIASAEPLYAGSSPLPDGKARQRRDAVYARSPEGTRTAGILTRGGSRLQVAPVPMHRTRVTEKAGD